MTVQPGSFALSQIKPEDVGFSSERLGRIRTALDRDIADSLIPGAVVGIARRGRIAYLQATGYRHRESSAPLAPDAIFSIASMTKPMTSVAIMALVEEGRVLLADPVSKYLPDLGELYVAVADNPGRLATRPASRQPTVLDLLRHTSGWTYRERGTTEAHARYPGSSINAAVRYAKPEFLKALAAAPLLHDPGTVWEYGFSTDVLGLIVEAVTGRTLGEVLRERIWGPLRMADTSFDLGAARRERYARALGLDPLTGQKQTIHHATDEKFQWESGGGGAVSTVADYLLFAEMLRQGGALGGARVLGRKTVSLMTADHLMPGNDTRIADVMEPAATGYGFGLGFAVRRADGGSALMGSAGDFYWSGVYGTYFWIDPHEEMSCVFMAAAPGAIRLRYRQMMRALVYQALVD